MSAKSVFMAEEWKLGLETKKMASGVVSEFEIFGASCFQGSPCKQRCQLCAVAYENSSFSMCDPQGRGGGAWRRMRMHPWKLSWIDLTMNGWLPDRVVSDGGRADLWPQCRNAQCPRAGPHTHMHHPAWQSCMSQLHLSPHCTV